MSTYTKNLWIDGAHFQVRLTGGRKGEATVEVRQAPFVIGEVEEWQTAGTVYLSPNAICWIAKQSGISEPFTSRRAAICYLAIDAARGIVLRSQSHGQQKVEV